MVCPEATAGEFVWVGGYWAVVGGAVDEDKLALTLALEDIMSEGFGREINNAEFLAHFATKGGINVFAEVNVSTGGCVPTAWLYVFPVGTLLQVELATAVEKVEVDHGVEYLGSAVSLAA